MRSSTNPDALFDEAVAAKDAGHAIQAADYYARAIALRPGFAQARVNLGNLLIELGRPGEAIAHYDCAIDAAPNYAQAFANKAVALAALNRHEAAVTAYDQALTVAPAFKAAQYGKALRLLQLGRYAQAWPLCEARWACPPHSDRPYSDKPYWTGAEFLRGETLLVHAEQGLGDTLQFCRYLDDLADREVEILLHVDPALHPLFETWPAIGALLREGDPTPRFDRHVSLVSLPLAFQTTLESLPGRVAYVSAPADRVRWWRTRWPKTRYRVGLAWAGNPGHDNDRNRSIPIGALSPLLGVDVEFVCLQKQLRDGDAAAMAARGILNPTEHLGDFGDTAALAETCDLVISVDTSVAHLAGAMGRPVWILLPFASDWRWLTDRNDSPWYPSARLLRQPSAGDWPSVIAKAAKDLAARIAGPAQSWSSDANRSA